MDAEMNRVLQQYAQLKADSLDLHALFEAEGNDPQARRSVIDTVARLIREGYLEEHTSDFYALTEKGKRALGRK